MTIDQIRFKAINLIEDVITLQVNVQNGCYADKAELQVKKARLEGIKTWAIENNQINNIKHFFAANNFGQNRQFVAFEISKFFNN